MDRTLTDPTIFAFTFARGGSKGLPNKNIKILDGKPLIAHAIEATRESDFVRSHFVSTDSKAIADAARRAGGEIAFARPAHLATDTSPEILAWKHAIEEVRALGRSFDLMLSVPTTSPLRRSEDIDRAIRKALESDADLVITVSEARNNPYFNMVELDASGRAKIVCPQSSPVGRQSAPLVFDMTTVAYVAKPEYVLRARTLMEGDVRAIVVPPESAIDIDDALDFAFAEFLLQRRRNEN